MEKIKNNGGRPQMGISDKRRYKVTVKMNTQEYYYLRGLALQTNQNLSETVREIIEKGYVKERISQEHLVLIRQLIGMANNLNQLSKNAHIFGLIELEKQNKELAKAIISTIDLLG